MPAPGPQVTIAKPAGGVLPISAVTSQANAAVNGTTTGQSKAPAARLKVVVRRLPPGLTRHEFENALGDEWALGKGKVDWLLYKPGKVSKDLAKPSRPSRGYLQVTAQSHLGALSEAVHQASFQDAQNTFNDMALIGLPTLEVAPYGRIPNSKRRNDARQGLIDQDPEFIEFLESLTNPLPKPANIDASSDPADRKDEAVTVSPLIQYLRDKKAAKEKAGTAKSAKHGRQTSKPETVEAKAEGKSTAKGSKQSSEVSEKKGRLTKSERQAAKTQKKEPTIIQAKPKAVTEATSDKSKPEKEPQAKKSDTRAPVSAASIIQRDLGLKGRGGTARRGGRQATSAKHAPDAGSEADAKAASETTSQDKSISSPPATPTEPVAPVAKTADPSKPQSSVPTGPAATRKTELAKQQASKATSPAQPSSNAKQSSTAPTNASGRAKPSPAQVKPQQPSQSATQAFLKHANASQGITEPLLEEAMVTFGAVAKVEIDKRKGFAYVDFAEPAGLQKAMAASPVKVAQGSVQVLERKDRPAAKQPPPAASAAAAAAAGGAAAGRGAAARGTAFGPAFRGGRGAPRGRGGLGRGGNNAASAATAPSASAADSAGDTATNAVAATSVEGESAAASAPAAEPATTSTSGDAP